MTSLDDHINRWREWATARPELSANDIDELDDHLRGHAETLLAAGLSEDEAFIIATRRVGAIDSIAGEFALENSERLWKQLVIDTDPPAISDGRWSALGFAVVAGLMVVVPGMFGVGPAERPEFWFLNGPLLVFAVVAAWFGHRRAVSTTTWGVMAAAGIVGAVAINAQPFETGGATFVLAGVHLAVAAWFLVGFSHAGGHWRSVGRRMDFVRFTGEWLVYYGLIAIGGGLLIALTFGVFSAVGIDAEPFVTTVVIPGGAAGATVIAAWLVEAKQAVIENIAPVLTALFAPLFTVLLIAVLVAGAIQGDLVGAARDLLIMGDLILVAAVAIVLYAWSARSSDAVAGWNDRLHVLLVAAAVLVDLVVLGALAWRTSEYGWSPNKAASLGLNLILLVNLLGAGWLSSRFALGRAKFARLIEWQTAFVPVLVVWSLLVVLGFGLAFDFS